MKERFERDKFLLGGFLPDKALNEAIYLLAIDMTGKNIRGTLYFFKVSRYRSVTIALKVSKNQIDVIIDRKDKVVPSPAPVNRNIIRAFESVHRK